MKSMAGRLNLLFQNAPRQFLERTVLFTNRLSTPESQALLRHRITHHIDLEPSQQRCSARVFTGLNQYQDLPLTTYVALPGQALLVPKADPPSPFVFFPEFVRCRLLVKHEEADWLHLQLEENLAGPAPAPERQKDTPWVDSFAYWDYTHGHLVGHIRATAVLVKEPGLPWTMLMQQIVGSPGQEVVRALFAKSLSYQDSPAASKA